MPAQTGATDDDDDDDVSTCGASEMTTRRSANYRTAPLDRDCAGAVKGLIGDGAIRFYLSAPYLTRM